MAIKIEKQVWLTKDDVQTIAWEIKPVKDKKTGEWTESCFKKPGDFMSIPDDWVDEYEKFGPVKCNITIEVEKEIKKRK